MRAPAVFLIALSVLPAGCASADLSEPRLTPVGNPADVLGSRVTTPLPQPRAETAAPASLWRAGARSFFGDQRAAEVGDILTIQIEIEDSAQVSNSTQRSRTASQDAGIGALLGLEAPIQRALPGSPDLDPAIAFDSSSQSNGLGTVNRAEAVNLTVAAVIVEKLPNGNLVIGGSQEVRINNEVRELLISGIIRPEDIAADNTIAHSKIAEARISYGGRGDLSQVQRPRIANRLY